MLATSPDSLNPSCMFKDGKGSRDTFIAAEALDFHSPDLAVVKADLPIILAVVFALEQQIEVSGSWGKRPPFVSPK